MITPLRVLLVEDSPADAKLVLLALRGLGRAVEHERVESAEAMRAALGRGWDLVLSDWAMPSFNALGALAVLQQTGVDIPFILVSGTIGEEAAVDAMRAGAHDYVLKDKLARLSPAVERELRECIVRRRAASQRARFEAMVEHSADGIGLSAADGTILYLSAAAARMLGRRSDELLGTKIVDVMHPDDAATASQDRVRLLAGETGPPTVRRFLRPDGSIRWIEVTATNRLEDPAVGAIISNVRDVTDRKLADDERLAAQRRFTALFESGIIGIIITDPSGIVKEANDTFLAMLGYTREDLAAGLVDWKKATPPEWLPWNVQATEQLRVDRRVPPREKEYFRKDGTRVPVLTGVASIDGSHAIALSVDLTDRKRADAALVSIEAQLRQAQKMEAVGRLAGGVAHDFNNILSVILSYADLLLEDLEPTSSMRPDLQEIQEAGKRAASLTRQLLMFSRQQIVEPTVVDLNSLLRNMDKMLQRIVGEDVELIAVTERLISGVLVDPSSIEQVVMNLVVNARDAMPTGGKITIETDNVALDEAFARAHSGVKPGAHVMLAVKDTGCGMDEATQRKIFEPFFTTKEKGKGTGLGLSTAFGIVMQSGGTIWVESEVGKGTTFAVYLPVAAGANAVRDNGTTQPRASTIPGTETILLVEDEEQVRVITRTILERNGYKVIEARDGGEGFALCQKHPGRIDLLLSDVVMPQMSGPELAKQLSQARPEMKVLCMSGYTDDSIMRHGVVEAHFAFLQKPITPEALIRKVREVLDSG